MNYPNKINKEYHKTINYANRGMDLEAIINEANEYYLEKDIALINNKQTIEKAYFATQSTLDYNGLYKGKYIEFDAKNTESRTSFPLSNVHAHQIKHIRNVIRHGGIVFLIIRINGLIYLLNGPDFISYIDENTRKSIPYEYIKQNGYELEYNYNKGLDYLKYVNVIGGFINEKN